MRGLKTFCSPRLIVCSMLDLFVWTVYSHEGDFIVSKN